MLREDGSEVLVRLAFPLPITIVPELLKAIGKVAERAGYTDVVLLTDDNGAIAGTPPSAERARRTRTRRPVGGDNGGD